MNGTASDIGILPRCLDVIFNSIGNYQAEQNVSFLHLYTILTIISNYNSGK